MQAQSVPNDRFSANRFVPAPGAGNYLMVDGALVGGHMTPSAGLLLDYAHRPFSLYAATCTNGDPNRCSVKQSKVDIISYQLAFDAMGSISLWQRLQIGLVFPVLLTSGDSFSASTPGYSQPYVDIRGGQAFALGDPRLSAKVRLVGQGSEGFALALVGYMTAPMGHITAKARSVGDPTITGGGHVAAEYGVGKLRFGANVGAIARPNRELLSTKVGSELTYGVGGSFQATPLLRAIAEVTGATHLTNRLDENPVEIRAGAELSVGDFAILGALGTGITKGVGIPDVRVIAGAVYRPVGLDADGDGVSDAKDACPTEKEDQDGFQDDDGCPDLDNDNDGIPDTADKCPDQAEDPDGFEDNDGCPDLDNDKDGIQDGYDSCPNEPEDKDGDRDDDGCPDNDRDRDGVPDDVDKCPTVPEDTDGFGDEDGCPETDYDGDGIPDDEDQCPDQPEDMNGVEDTDGCPEGKPVAQPEAPAPPSQLVKVTCEKIEIGEKIYFKTGSDVIESRSFGLLMQIANALKQATQIERLRIEGHTDNRGNAKKNLKLSDRRAGAVRSFLVKAGVEAERLESRGFGQDNPIADNKTSAGREQNRRVEFVIVKQSSDCKK